MTRRLAILVLLFSPALALAQFTTVTASSPTIPNATFTFDFINLSGQKGPPLLGGISVFPTQFVGNFDSFGSLSALLADNNQVLPLTSQWRLSIGLTPCPGIKQGFNIQLTITGSAQNISSQINAAIPPSPPACNTGGGGAGNPAPPSFSVQFNNGGVFGGSTRSTLDLAGNLKARSYDGLFSALDSQTTLLPPSNDGLQQALSTPGAVAVAFPDYALVEGILSSNSTCVGNNWRDAIGCPPPFANNTLFFDYRANELGSYAYNLNMGTELGIVNDQRWVSNQQAQSSGGGNNVYTDLRDYEMFGSGKNGFDQSGGPDSFLPFLWNFENYRRGIVSVLNIGEQNGSIGDNHLIQYIINNNRGTSAGSDEGFNTVRVQIQQNLTPMATSANSTLAAGATLIPGTLISTVPFVSDGTYYINFTKGGPIFNITALTNPAPTVPGQFTINTTLTPDNIGFTAAAINTPKQYNGATTNETFTVTGLASAIVTTSTVCIADHNYQESARVVSVGSFSGGTQSITAALRYVHSSATVSQGPNACDFIEIRANQVNPAGAFPGKHLYRVIGAVDATHVLYSRTVAGNWQPPSGYFSTNVVVPAGTLLTRNGSNQVSATVSDPFLVLSKVFTRASGCADSSFNGDAAITSDNGTVVTWNSVGSAGTTTCTNAVEIQSQLNGLVARSAQIFHGAEIVNPLDPVTHANNFNITVEPNTNLQVTSGDRMENHVYSDVLMGLDHNLISFNTQTSSCCANIMHFDQFDGQIPEAFTWQYVTLNSVPGDYIGLGGTKPIAATLFDMSHNQTPFLNLWNGLPAPNGTAFSFIGCLYGCADVRSKFTWVTIPTNNGNYSEVISQNVGKMETTTNNSTNNMTMRIEPGDFDIISTGTGLNDILTIVPGEYLNTVGGGGGTLSKFDQTVTTFTNTVTGVSSSSHVTQTLDRTTSDVPYVGPSVAPSGACTPNGGWVFSSDGHATFCNAGTWVVKI